MSISAADLPSLSGDLGLLGLVPAPTPDEGRPAGPRRARTETEPTTSARTSTGSPNGTPVLRSTGSWSSLSAVKQPSI